VTVSVTARRLLVSLVWTILIMAFGYLWMPFSIVTHFLLWLLAPIITKVANSGGDWFLTEFLPFVGATLLNLIAWVAIIYFLLKRTDERRGPAVGGDVA
jgi:hypothetical protein